MRGVGRRAGRGWEGAGGRGRAVYGRVRVVGRPTTTTEAGEGREAVGGQWDRVSDPKRAWEIGGLARERREGAETHRRQQRPPGPEYGLLGQRKQRERHLRRPRRGLRRWGGHNQSRRRACRRRRRRRLGPPEHDEDDAVGAAVVVGGSPSRRLHFWR